ncbi:MAG: hypothetical protein RLZZ562_1434 [Planctomycetota bacterium]|jgi:hypothetical protein
MPLVCGSDDALRQLSVRKLLCFRHQAYAPWLARTVGTVLSNSHS